MTIKFDAITGLVPAVVQDVRTGKVLMLGYMNQEALDTTRSLGKVTFYSRSKGRLWTKGETSQHFLICRDILIDCDADTILIKAEPMGPTCHTGADTCFGETNQVSEQLEFLSTLVSIIRTRKQGQEENSYTHSLFMKGIPAIAQKVGEEAVEVVIEAIKGDKVRLREEAADLLFHYMVLLESTGLSMAEIVGILRERNEKRG